MGGRLPRWRMDGKELFYRAADDRFMAAAVGARGGTFEVTGVVPLLGSIGNVVVANSYDVSADGQRFLMLVQEAGNGVPPLTVVQNWLAAITRGK